jgi:hypothetical protein
MIAGTPVLQGFVSKNGTACPAGMWVQKGQMKRNAPQTWLVVLALLLTNLLGLPSTAVAQEKLEEVVRRTRGNVSFFVNRQITPADLPDLVAQADLIVRVLVIDGRSGLTSNEREIETNYTVQILEVYAERPPILAHQRIVVTKPGGTITSLGHSVTMAETDFPEFDTGEEYVLFLRQDRARQVNHVVFGSQGAFRLEGGYADQASKFTGKIKQERGKLPLPAFSQEIRELVGKR